MKLVEVWIGGQDGRAVWCCTLHIAVDATERTGASTVGREDRRDSKENLRRKPARKSAKDNHSPQPSQKTFRIKQKLAKKSRQNRPVPQWFRLKTDSE